MKKTLHLILIRKWFLMIKSGEKLQEYRKITPYFCSKFLLFEGERRSRKRWSKLFLFEWDGSKYGCIKIKSSIRLEFHIKTGLISFTHHDSITFSNGMTPPVPRFEIDKKGISIGEGNPDWGAIPGKKYFVVELGKIS